MSLILFAIYSSYAIEFVSIEHPGNIANKYGYGALDYLYYIGKYEVTNAQYCDFLNCVAQKADSNRLFSPLMQQHFFGGIIRDGRKGCYSYQCKPGYENRPIVGVTWMSAIRFINWLHYNADNIENEVPIAQWSARTEGTDVQGAYDTRSVPCSRNKNALYWLPNRSEWEKHITMEISGCMILFYQMPIVLVLNLAGIALSPILRKLDFLRGLMVHLINKAMPQNGLKIQQQIAFGNLLWVAALFDRKNMHIVE